MEYASNFHVVIATIYHSVRLLKNILDAHPYILGAYYIQDYEPWFFDKGTENWDAAYTSYTLIKGLILMAKTDWLCSIIEEKHGVKVEKVSPSLDNDLFYPTFKENIGSVTVKVVAMVRPITPRRGAERTMRHLKKLKQEFGNKFTIEIFGCEDHSEQFKLLDRNFEFHNHGILTRENVAKLLQDADVFIDLSDYQAFGRSGFEAMACGCAVVLPSKGGVYEYAIHNENALIVDTANDEQIYEALQSLIHDDNLRKRLIYNGIASVSKFSIHHAAITKLLVLIKKYKEKKCKDNLPVDITEHFTNFTPLKKQFTKRKIRVAGLVSLRPDGTPAGSAHIRVIQPLTHPDVSKYIDFKMCSLSGLWHTNADLLLVQRNMLSNPEIAYELVKYSKRNGKRIIFEIDDDLFQLSKTRRGEGIYPKSSLEAMEVMAVEAHKVIVSSMPLKEKIDKMNRNVICIPNALDENIWLEKNEKFFIKPDISIKAKDQYRILYMGTRTHAKDLLIVQEAYKLIKKEYGNKVTLQIIGGVPVGEKIFGEVININDSSPMTDNYLGFVKSFRLKNNWRLGLIPLVKSPFNRMKSYIKFLDYSALGIPSICTDIEPYREVVRNNENAILVDNDKESWYIAIKKMIDDETFRNTIADNAYSDLVRKHILCHRVKDFLSAYYYPIENLL
jgi:glycosyltransferase involved in cell wall biosynthesis